MNAPSLAVLLTWALALGWFCLLGAWAGALARPATGVVGAVRVSLWLGFGLATAFVLAVGLVQPLRSTAAVVAAAVLTVLAAAAWLNAPLDLDMVFTTPPDDLWERAIRSLGVEPTAIAAAPGIH